MDFKMQFRLSGAFFKFVDILTDFSSKILLFVLIQNKQDVTIEVYRLFPELGSDFQIWNTHQTFEIVIHELDLFEKTLLKQLLAIWARCSLRHLSEISKLSIARTFDSVQDAHKGLDQSTPDLVNILPRNLMVITGAHK